MIDKKLYIYIYIYLITFALLLFSCEEKKTKDAKTVVDQTKKTPPALTKPVLSAQRVRKETPITFPKVEGYTYALKPVTSGVTLSDVEGDTTKKQVRSTVVVSGVIVVATKGSDTIESDPIDFLFYVADKKALEAEIAKAIKAHGATADLSYIDTSEVTDMSRLFEDNIEFNGDISKWNTSSVTSMREMFSGASAFNQSLNSWDVSKVTDMNGIFYNASAFNRPLKSWDVSSVKNISYMLGNATKFNQDLSGWAEKSGRKSTGIFRRATAMQPLNKSRWTR